MAKHKTRSTRSTLVAAAILLTALALLLWATLRADETSPGSGAPADAPQGDVAETARWLPSAHDPSKREQLIDTGAAAQSADVSADALQVTVQAEDGAPVPRAAVLLQVNKHVQEQTTDAAGRARFDFNADEARLLVLPQSRPPHGAILTKAALQTSNTSTDTWIHSVALPQGATVAGRVVLEGSLTPAAGVPLRLAAESYLFDLDPVPHDLWTSPLQDALERRGDVQSFIHVNTDAAGRFAFTGLKPDWTGEISFPEYAPFAWRASGASLRVTDPTIVSIPGPTSELLLVLARLPAVFGHVQLADGTPADGAEVEFYVELEADEFGGGEALCDETGYFSIRLLESHGVDGVAVAWPKVLAAELEVDDLRGAQEFRRTWAAGELPRSGDLGTLTLQGLRELHVIIEDTSDQPVAGATVKGARETSVTDARGKCTVHVVDPSDELPIGARGFAIARYPSLGGLGTAAQPSRYVLMPGNAWVVRLDADLALAKTTQLQIEMSEPVFEDLAGTPEELAKYRATQWQFSPSPLHHAGGAPLCQSSTHSSLGSGSAKYAWDERGEVHLPSVLPGRFVIARVLSHGGISMCESRVQLPAAEGRLTTVLSPPTDNLCVIQGQVMHADEPVWASLELGSLWQYAGVDGEFRFVVLASGEEFALKVRADDFIPQETTVQLVAGTAEHKFELVPSYELLVKFVGPDGPVSPGVFKPIDSAHAKCIPLADGVHIRPLPAGLIELNATLSGRTFPISVDPSVQPTVVVRTPRLVKLQVLVPKRGDVRDVNYEVTDVHGNHVLMVRDEPMRTVNVFPGVYQVRATAMNALPWKAVWTIPDAKPPGGIIRRTLFEDR